MGDTLSAGSGGGGTTGQGGSSQLIRRETLPCGFACTRLSPWLSWVFANKHSTHVESTNRARGGVRVCNLPEATR
jgi:hypothetical protein